MSFSQPKRWTSAFALLAAGTSALAALPFPRQGQPAGSHAPSSPAIQPQPCEGPLFPHAMYATGGLAFSAASDDLDGDGDKDLAVANLGTHNVSVLLNEGAGTLARYETYGTGSSPYSVAIGDLDVFGDVHPLPEVEGGTRSGVDGLDVEPERQEAGEPQGDDLRHLIGRQAAQFAGETVADAEIVAHLAVRNAVEGVVGDAL